jgi:hypothetical protein
MLGQGLRGLGKIRALGRRQALSGERNGGQNAEEAVVMGRKREGGMPKDGTRKSKGQKTDS